MSDFRDVEDLNALLKKYDKKYSYVYYTRRNKFNYNKWPHNTVQGIHSPFNRGNRKPRPVTLPKLKCLEN